MLNPSEPTLPARLEVLIRQSEVYAQDMRAELQKIHHMQIWSFTLIGAVATVTIRDRIYEVGFVLPMLIALCGFISIGIFKEIFALSAARDFADEQLTAELVRIDDSNLASLFIPWGLSGQPYTTQTFAKKMSLTLYWLFSLTVSVLTTSQTWHHYHHLRWLLIVTTSISASLFVLLVPLALRTRGTYKLVMSNIAEIMNTRLN